MLTLIRQNFSFKILTKIQLQSLDEKSASKPWQNITFYILTNIQLQNLDQTVVNTFFSINISNTNNIKKSRIGILKSQSYINQVY